MLARLGDVLYWGCSIASVLWLLFTVVLSSAVWERAGVIAVATALYALPGWQFGLLGAAVVTSRPANEAATASARLPPCVGPSCRYGSPIRTAPPVATSPVLLSRSPASFLPPRWAACRQKLEKHDATFHSDIRATADSGGRQSGWCSIKSPISGVFTVVSLREDRRFALSTPNFSARASRVLPEVLVPLGEVPIDRHLGIVD
jgi:hypothetical protein